MKASSVTRRVLASLDARKWAWWQTPWPLRLYVGLIPLVALVLGIYAATQTTWHASDLAKFVLLLGCGMVSVAATPRTAYIPGGMTRDFLTVWVLPVAILLPPVYAMLTPIPLQILTQTRVHRGIVYRRVFTVAAFALAYGLASVVFRTFPASFAGPSIGSGTHALTFTVAVALCEIIGGRGHQLLIVGGIKLTIVVAVNAVLAIFAVPTVLLVRRFMMHAQLLAQSRVDTKTGLLNASTWEAEAEVEITRAVRTGSPLALALVDIDHFKAVNDTYGHLVGDKALRAVTDALRSQLRAYDLAGRFGGEEFAILLPHAREVDALHVAERLRAHIAQMVIPVGDDPDSGPGVRVTISVGVASLDGTSRELTDMLAAADAALYYAKETGRNKTHVIPASAPAS